MPSVSPINLRRDDSDVDVVYDGRKQTPGVGSIPAIPKFIEDLHELLTEFDIAMFRDIPPNGAGSLIPLPGFDPKVFGRHTEWAVREFQIFASMSQLRTGAGSSAASVANTSIYAGPISGYVDEATRNAMSEWQSNGFKAPVVISAIPKSVYGATRPNPDTLPATTVPITGGENLWRHHDFPVQKNARMFARDFSQFYARTNGGSPDANDLKNFQVLGGYVNSQYGSGLESKAVFHSWPEAEFDHEDFGPIPTTDAEKKTFFSTFRVVAAVARVECEGFYDVVNAYDRAVESFGLVHWTIFDRKPGSKKILGVAELPASFAYMQLVSGLLAFDNAFGKFGIGFANRWTHRSGSNSGVSKFNNTLKNYRGLATLQSVDGKFDAREWTIAEASHLKSWHWFYRFVMAGRLRPELRKAMWDLARIRIRDLLSATWPAGGTHPTIAGNPATLGETFTSERAIALLLRWHVLRPGKLLATDNNGVVKADLRMIWTLANAGTPFPTSVASWGDNEQRRLIKAIYDRAKSVGGGLWDSVETLSKWFDIEETRTNISPKPGLKVRNIDGVDPLVEKHDTVQDVNAPISSHVETSPGVFQASKGLLTSLNASSSSLSATHRVRTFMNGVLTTNLATHVKLSRKKKDKDKRWLIEEFESLLPTHSTGMNLLRRFEVTLATLSSPFVVREIPSLSIKDDSFKFFPDGLPAIPRKTPLGDFEVPATDLTAGPITTNLEGKLQAVLAKFPTMKFDLSNAHVVVEEPDNRWCVYLDSTPDINETFLTLRMTSVPGDIAISVDPPGCSQRYRGRTLRLTNTGPEITELRNDLIKLGFALVSGTSASFDDKLLDGVREFQAYAKSSTVARTIVPPPPIGSYSEKLEPVTNQQRYSGPVSGVVNHETRALIDYWISENHRLRCPVVVESCTDATGTTVVNQNLWDAAESGITTNQRMFVVDFTGGTRIRKPLGSFVEHLSGTTSGPSIRNDADFRPSETSSEALPLAILGTATPDADQSKVFRIIRAIYEEAFGGFLDGVDASTLGGTGLGIFRLNDRSSSGRIVGSLGMLLSHTQEYQLADYRNTIENAGIAPDIPWHPIGKPANGRSLLTSRLMALDCGYNFENDNFPFDKNLKRFNSGIREDHLRNWHWTYRLAKAGRTPGFAFSAGELIQLRQRDLGVLTWPDNSLNGAGTTKPKLSDVFTSELAWVILIRWHFLHPEDIVDKSLVHQDLASAITAAGLTTSPSTWTNDEESILITVLRDYLASKHSGSTDAARVALNELSQWPRWTAEDPADNPRGFTLDLFDFVETSPMPIAGHAADLDSGILPAAIKSTIATFTGDDTWNTDASVGVTRKRAGEFWIATYGFRTIPMVRQGTTLQLRLGLSPRRNSLTASAAQLAPLPPPAYAVSGSGNATQTALIELCPPLLDSGGQKKFGISLLTSMLQDASSGAELEFDQVVLSLPGAAPVDPLEGIAIPVTDAFRFAFELVETTRTGMVSGSDGVISELPLLTVDPTSSLPSDTVLNLDIGHLLAIEDVIKIDGATMTLAGLSFGSGHVVGTMQANLPIDIPFLQRPFDLSFAGSGDSGSVAADFDRLRHDSSTGIFEFDPLELVPKFSGGFPFQLPAALPFNLIASLDGGKLDAAFAADLTGNEPLIDLGSPLAQLKLSSPLDLKLSLQDGLDVAVKPGEDLGADLVLDLFAEALGATPKVINHLWETITADPGDFGKLLKVSVPGGIAAPVEPLVSWRDRRPSVNTRLFEALTVPTVNPVRRLRTFAGDLLGTTVPCLAKFKNAVDGTVNFGTSDDGRSFRLEVPIRLVLDSESTITGNPNPLLEAEGSFGFEVGFATDGDQIRVTAGALKVDPEVVIRVNSPDFARGFRLGDLLSVHVPEGTAFVFQTDPRNPGIRWDRILSEEKTQSKIVIRCPAIRHEPEEIANPIKFRFSFEINELEINNRGFDLGSFVRAEKVEFGEELESGFDKDAGLAVQKPESKTEEDSEPVVGELLFQNSRLTYGSLQAGCKLRYFDDANGTFKVVIAQDPKSNELQVEGTFDITGTVQYRVDALYSLFRLKHLHIGTRWTGAHWKSDGHMTGAVEFKPPQGGSASKMGPLSELFSEVTCEFERLNPVKIGEVAAVRFLFPTKQFEFAKVFTVDLRGIEIGADENKKTFGLLGDITIKELPGVDSQLTFGGITLSEGSNSFPDFSVNRIGARLSTAGGFTIEGLLELIKTEEEIGFGGSVSIETDALPRLSGLVKLTLAKTTEDGKTVATFAVYFEADHEIPLFAEFYLRSLGVGIGINQALDGLKPDSRPLPQRISAFVDDPDGLPNPRTLAAWVPDPPPKRTSLPHWMVVANGLITLNKLPMDKPHTLLGTVLIALDHELQLTVGVNIWLFASPNEVRSLEFQRNPVARGAIAFSPREKMLSAYFRTLPNPKMGKNAPELIGKVLNSVQTSLRFQADRNGVLYEVGWPWETKINIPSPPLQAPLRGKLTSGYRYALYRGVLCYGLNFAIEVGFDAEAGVNFRTRLGSAGASFKVTGSGYLRCSFTGAVDSSLQPRLLGDVRVGATVKVKAEAHVSLSKKISRWFKIRLRINFSATVNVSITAALTAAMNTKGIGFDGSAHVSVSVKGYRLAGRVKFQHKDEKIESVRKDLEKLLPPPIDGRSGITPFAAAAISTFTVPEGWTYRHRRMGDTDTIAVCLLPRSGRNYPGIDVDPNDFDPAAIGTRYKVKLTPEGDSALRGFLGDSFDPPVVGGFRVWEEKLDHEVMSPDQILEEYEQDDSSADADRPKALTVLHFLSALAESHETAPPQSEIPTEDTQDQRIVNPTSADMDDATVGVAPEGLVSPYIQRDNEYDAKVSSACRRELPPDTSETKSEGLSTGMLAAEVLEFFRNEQAEQSVSDYTIAPYLRCILLFDLSGLDSTIRDAADPVPLLIADDPDTTLAGDANVEIESVNSAAVGRSYDLLPGHVFQSDSEIALAWDFAFEERRPEDNMLTVYESGFEVFRVTRINLSRSSAKPQTIDVSPCWLDPGDGDGSLVRPQFQFVDQEIVNDVNEGDLLQYRVEAIGQDGPDDPLTSCLFNVVRQTVEPLAPPVQAVAFHKPIPQQLVPPIPHSHQDDGTIEIAVMSPEDEDGFLAEDLHIRARMVAANEFGAYGFEHVPDVQLETRSGLPDAAATSLAGKDEFGVDKYVPEIRFTEQRRGRPLPWEETVELALPPGLNWSDVKVMEGDGPKRVGFRVELPLTEFRRILEGPEAFDRPISDEKAIELSVGRLKVPTGNQGSAFPIQRSTLATCRHAILLAERATTSAADVFASDFFLQGNETAAIEFLPPYQRDKTADVRFLRTGMFAGVVEQTPVESLLPDIRLTCRMPAETGMFNPTTGFRIHQVDRLDPYRFRTVREGEQARFVRDVEVLPESIFRSTPNSIDLISIKTANPATNDTEITADWQATNAARPIWEPVAPPATIPGFTYSYAFKRFDLASSIRQELEPRWLHDDINAILQRLIELLAEPAVGGFTNVTISFKAAGKFEDKADVEADTDATNAAQRAARFLSEFENATSQHNDFDDPYGWAAAEFLGLSCEFLLLDEEGTPLPIDELIRKSNLLEQLAGLWGPDPRPAASLAFFLGEDGESYLNVMRIIYSGPWPRFATPAGFSFHLGIALQTAVLGRNPDGTRPAFDPDANSFDVAVASIVDSNTEAWARDAADRIARSFNLRRVAPFDDAIAIEKLDLEQFPDTIRETLGLMGSGPIDVDVIRTSAAWVLTVQESGAQISLLIENQKLVASLLENAGGTAVTYQRAPGGAASVGTRLPIDRDGLVRARLSVPDRLAHQYDFALAIIRRYDRLWQALVPPSSTATDPETDIIPFEKIRPLAVDRTEKLVKHNVVATPLPGSIQAFVFTHPAEFASTSSALNAAHIQYSGQTVALERRITNRERVEEILAGGFGSVDWSMYLDWVQNVARIEDETAGPSLHFTPQEATSLALKPIAKTRFGIYGADRYVYPDLPAYYEYRLIAWSSAGRAKSPPVATRFVRPLHDQAKFQPDGTLIEPARQQPRTDPIQFSNFEETSKRVTLEVRLIHPRRHLRDEVAGLWIASEEELELGGSQIRYGSLPDLFLEYQVYIQLNIIDGNSRDEIPTLTPLLQIIPPTDPNQPPAGTAFMAKVQDQNIHLVDGGGSVQELNLNVAQQTDGELRWNIVVDFTDSPTLIDLLERAKQAGVLSEQFHISVKRGGAYSQIIDGGTP